MPHVAAACFVGFSRKQDKKNLSEREAFGGASSAETGGGQRVESDSGAVFLANTTFVDFPLVFFLAVYLVDVCGRGVACLVCFVGSFCSLLKKTFLVLFTFFVTG
jgi:hypothetical protein